MKTGKGKGRREKGEGKREKGKVLFLPSPFFLLP
jgi:hypothetical protein